jgi:hypothetical protein
MLRRSHVFGLAGLIMIVVGVGLYLTGSVHKLSTLYWLGGPFLCFAGAALFMGSILWPVFYRSADKSGPATTSRTRRDAG